LLDDSSTYKVRCKIAEAWAFSYRPCAIVAGFAKQLLGEATEVASCCCCAFEATEVASDGLLFITTTATTEVAVVVF